MVFIIILFLDKMVGVILLEKFRDVEGDKGEVLILVELLKFVLGRVK